MTKFLSVENANRLSYALRKYYGENEWYNLTDRVLCEMVEWYRKKYDPIRHATLHQINEEFIKYFMLPRTISTVALSDDQLKDGLHFIDKPEYKGDMNKYDPEMYKFMDKIGMSLVKAKRNYPCSSRIQRINNRYGNFTSEEVLKEVKLDGNLVMNSLTEAEQDEFARSFIRNRYNRRRNLSRTDRVFNYIEDSELPHTCCGANIRDCRACEHETNLYLEKPRTPFELSIGNSPFTMAPGCKKTHIPITQYELAAELERKNIIRNTSSGSKLLGNNQINDPYITGRNECYNEDNLDRLIKEEIEDYKTGPIPTTSRKYIERGLSRLDKINKCRLDCPDSTKETRRIECKIKEELRSKGRLRGSCCKPNYSKVPRLNRNTHGVNY